MLSKTYILGVGITTAAKDKILELIDQKLSEKGKSVAPLIIFTPNPEQISQASGDASLRDTLNQADIALPDGVGVIIAARLLGKPLYSRITGVDFIEELLGHVSTGANSSSKKLVNTGYFGSGKGVAEAASKCLKAKYPQVSIGYASDVYNREKMIQSDVDILFVALGFPKQEKWILEHKDEVKAKIIMGVGGSLDFISGKVPRAPMVIRLFSLEWLFRLIVQPWRFKRQLRLLHFSALVLQEALSNKVRKR